MKRYIVLLAVTLCSCTEGQQRAQISQDKKSADCLQAIHDSTVAVNKWINKADSAESDFMLHGFPANQASYMRHMLWDSITNAEMLNWHTSINRNFRK